jgi:hypothetical protein
VRGAEALDVERRLVDAHAALATSSDRLYVLACALGDVERDLAAGCDDPDELRRTLDWLLDAARGAVTPSEPSAGNARYVN